MEIATDSNNESTTIIVKGLPRQHSAWQVVEELDRFLCRSEFDFIYVPRKRYAKTNQGFTFINFVDRSTAESARGRISTNRWSRTGRPMVVASADVQGLRPNLRRFQRAVLQRDGGELVHEPLVFEDGHRIVFSDAIKKYCSEVAERFPADVFLEDAVALPPAGELFQAKCLSNNHPLQTCGGSSSDSVAPRPFSAGVEPQSFNPFPGVDVEPFSNSPTRLDASTSRIELQHPRADAAERPLAVDSSSGRQPADRKDPWQPEILDPGRVYSF